MASSKCDGTIPEVKDLLMILVISGTMSDKYSFVSLVGIGSRLQVFDGIDLMILIMSFADTCLKDESFGPWYNIWSIDMLLLSSSDLMSLILLSKYLTK